LEYLIATHSKWQSSNINLAEVRASLKHPVLVDNTTLKESEGNNVETTEFFKVFFPHESMSSLHGGQESLEKFQATP